MHPEQRVSARGQNVQARAADHSDLTKLDWRARPRGHVRLATCRTLQSLALLILGTTFLGICAARQSNAGIFRVSNPLDARGTMLGTLLVMFDGLRPRRACAMWPMHPSLARSW